MADDKCELCEDEPIVTIAGITRNISLCSAHIKPPYEMSLIHSIINEMKADTVISFLKTIHDQIEQDKRIINVESQINTMLELTKLNSVPQLTKEKDEALARIIELETLIISIRKELTNRDEELKKSSTIKQTIDKLQTTMIEKITLQKTYIVNEIKAESQNIVSQLKPAFSSIDSTVGRTKEKNLKRHGTEPKRDETQSEQNEEPEKDGSETGGGYKNEP